MLFKDLAIGDKFHTGISKAVREVDSDKWMVYKKVSKSLAECVEQIGYGNNRAIGNRVSMSVNKVVYKL